MTKKKTEPDDATDPLWQAVIKTVKAYPRSQTTRANRTTETFPERKKYLPAKKRKQAAVPIPAPPSRSKKHRSEKIEARVDLHGLDQAAAFKTLMRFVEKSQQRGLRSLLVITGKGRQSEGVLRRLAPLWLEESALALHIRSITTAGAEDGGDGAFYLKLRAARRLKDA